jgi:hypothetical protein
MFSLGAMVFIGISLALMYPKDIANRSFLEGFLFFPAM